MPASEVKPSLMTQIRGFPANYWVACSMEILERLAYFAVRAIAALYLVASAGRNGLDLDFGQKGMIYFVWALLQCLIPMVSGGFSDRYGYRKSLYVAFTINILGYVLMAQSRPIADALAQNGWQNAGFWVFMAAACMVATGTAIFKPPTQGTIAASTGEKTSSVAWGVFYLVVNIGGALAPMAAAILRKEIDWDNVFYFAAIITAVNFIPAIVLLKEPDHVVKTTPGESRPGILQTFFSSIATVFSDLRLVLFLAIFSCFWLMFMQVWDLLPNFIDEWVDTSDVASVFGWFSKGWVLQNGQTKPEMVINIGSMAIIVLVLPISLLIGRISKVAAMIIGMFISVAGFLGTGATSIGWFCCLAVFVFSIGEMACSPTFLAYVGLIAPWNKKALYMGYSNIPYAVGWALGNGISGFLYESLASKTNLARQFMVEQLRLDPSIVMDKIKLPKDKVMEAMAWARDGGPAEALRSAVDSFWINIPPGTVLSEAQADSWATTLDGVLGRASVTKLQEATTLLWDMHHPYVVWYCLGAVGLVGTLGMIAFYFLTRSTATRGGVETVA